MNETTEHSPKSYGVAVTLCGIFGTLGIHHFYLEDWWHGIADLILVVLTFTFFFQGYIGLFFITLLIDAVHTIVIFYLLIVENWRDGQGRLIVLGNPTA
ncbi:NINE protein [Sulfitobacter sp. JB4-11]|uniref:NINE protein n=1 Tax=Sulfitobacter rhodophyticola TaxID=3238304 RepID=UPI00351853E6